MAEAIYVYPVSMVSDKEWFHGELSTVQAEHALTVSACDCFLVRVNHGALILSLLHHGQVHHININFGPGWYKLDGCSSRYSFSTLEELVSHYRENTISYAMNMALGAVCENTDSQYQCITKETKPESLAKYKWYHGYITRAQATAALSSACKKFLVWHSSDTLMLSKIYLGRLTHTTIHHSPRGYQLEGSSKLFGTIPEMIAHYQQSLKEAVETVPSGQELKSSTSTNIFKKEMKAVQVNWKRCADLPVALSAPYVVKIGDNVYAGGGMSDGKATMANNVFKYNLHQDIWIPLPLCKTLQHSLTALNSELIAIGGIASNKATNAVRTFREGVWETVLPSMPTPRWGLSTVSHDNKMIIAAGGTTLVKSNGEQVRTDTVEIFITDEHAWFSTKSLPFPLVRFKTCIVGNVCYTLGGIPDTIDKTAIALYTTVSSLLENAIPPDSRASTPQVLITWKKLQGKHPLICSSPVELDGRLFAMGGSIDQMLRRGTRFISIYDFATDTWVKCKDADLPAPLYRPSVLKLDHNQVMIVGGQPKMKQFSAAVYIGNYKT